LEAAQLGAANLVESQLARGVDRKTLNEALFVAARSESLVLGSNDFLDRRYATVARLLLKKGAMIEARDVDGSTPLILAAGQGETRVVKLLLDKGADIEATDNSGGTALIAAACNCPIVDMPDTDDSVRMLLEKGANIEARDKQGFTALINAASWGRTSILKILLDKGALIDAKDNHGNTALLSASSGSGYPTAEAVQLLLAGGAEIGARNDNGDTALILAASNGGFEDTKIVKILLGKGADVGAQNNRGRTALDLAIEKGRAQIVSLLRAAPAKNRTVTGVEAREICGARVRAAAPEAGVNLPVGRRPFACAGRKPGWRPKMVWNCPIESLASWTSFSSFGSGISHSSLPCLRISEQMWTVRNRF
jgi:ankyrin repeat protein